MRDCRSSVGMHTWKAITQRVLASKFIQYLLQYCGISVLEQGLELG